MQISSTVPPQFVNWPISDYLATRFTYLSKDDWCAWVQAGKVLKDGRPCSLETIVTQGNLITCELPDWEQPKANFDYEIVYEDDWLLGINKPPNLRVHSGGRFLKANLMYQLKVVHDPAYPKAELVNRLDADTSGVVLVGKNRAVIREMGKLFAANEVEKEYLAVVVGVPKQTSGTIDWPIGRVVGSKVRFGVEGIENAKTAVTRYEVVNDEFSVISTQVSVVRVWPETGRTHQIRVHLAALGHPIVGDKLYRSTSDKEFVEWSNHPEAAADADLIQRQALHCVWTHFQHPFLNQMCRVQTPVSADIKQLLNDLQSM